MTDEIRRPDLSRSKKLVIDVETYDPGISKKMGPGVYRRKQDGSKLLGVSICDCDGFSEYYNLGHYDCEPDEREANVRYLREVLALPAPKIGTKAQYDADWLENGEYGFTVAGKLVSIEIAEALLDETQGQYSLDFMARKYLGEGKRASLPQQFCEEHGLKGDFRAWLWKMPYALVRDYARGDVEEPALIHEKQRALLVEQELEGLFEMECELLRCLLLMRKTGVRIDERLRDKHTLWTRNFLEEHWAEIERQTGRSIDKGDGGNLNLNSTQQLAALCRSMGLEPAKTEKGADSVTQGFIKAHRDQYPLLRLIDEAKRAEKMIDTFLQGSLLRFVTDGKIHCEFFNTRVDEYGTRSGRFSTAHPNLQQIPSKERKSRGERLDELCREVFVPEEDCLWGKADYSQIEYRFMAHFAQGPGAVELRAAYNNNPDQDYHAYIEQLTGLGRGLAKNLNFGLAYGMGAKHMSEVFGWKLDYCYEILNIYHARAPYVKATMEDVMKVAQRRGYIKTFLKRRSRLVDPAKAYIMQCRLMQGSAADLMKKAMIDCWKSGVFDILPPHLTVHDELDVSVPRTRAGVEAFAEMKHVMETCVKLDVPIKAELSVGPSWGIQEDVDLEAMKKEVP